MIDLSKETLISCREASKFFPPGRRGKKPHRSTIFRWITCGVRGVRLEAVSMPGGRATSKEAIARFLEVLTEQDERANPFRKPTAPSLDRRRKQIADAERELDKMGIK
jgi:Protein of unknown function (DUF1580)